MLRTQIYLTEEQHEQLARLARDRGASMAHLIREAISEYLVHQRATTTSPWLDLIGLGASGISDGALHHDRDIYDEG